MNTKSKKTVAFLSLGCKVNAYETESIEESFLKAGYEVKNFSEPADVYVVNTCTVTNIADRKSRQMLHRAKKLNPDAVVVAVGCYVQAPQSKLEDDDLVDILVGNRGKSEVLHLVEEYYANNREIDLKHNVIRSGDENANWTYEEQEVDEAHGKTRANIKIQDGCNQFCTYCIIPFVRGRIRSRNADDVIKEITSLADKGYREMVLTGIHIGSYGLDVDGKSHMEDLLKRIEEVPGDFRIRLGSVEPRLISEGFVKTLSKLTKICPHFHMSLQSGCDTVLKRMNRHYTTAEFTQSVELLREYLDEPGITTDIITGFPGETEEEFEQTLEFAEKIGFLKVHTFPYSRRSGTYADKMPDQIAEQVKKERERRLIAVANKAAERYLLKFNGKSERVLFEERIKGRDDLMIGHSDRYIEVSVPVSDLSNENGTRNFVTVDDLFLSNGGDPAMKHIMVGRVLAK